MSESTLLSMSIYIRVVILKFLKRLIFRNGGNMYYLVVQMHTGVYCVFSDFVKLNADASWCHAWSV